jgi:hypothetical protein
MVLGCHRRGLVFHAQIEYVFSVLEEMGRVSVILLGLLVAGYVLAKYLQRRQFLKTLRTARITVDELQALIQAGVKPTIIDVRSPGARARDGRSIPEHCLWTFRHQTKDSPNSPATAKSSSTAPVRTKRRRRA